MQRLELAMDPIDSQLYENYLLTYFISICFGIRLLNTL